MAKQTGNDSIKEFLEEQKKLAQNEPSKEQKFEKQASTDLVSQKKDGELEDVADKSVIRIPLGQKLIEKNLITKDQLEIALKIQREDTRKVMVGQILIEMGLVTEQTIAEILSENSGSIKFDFKKNIIDPNLIKQVPKDVVTRYKAMPVLMEDGIIYVAMTDVFNVLALDRIRRYFPKRFEIKPIHASEKDLNEIITNHYEFELSIDGILREMEGLSQEDAKTLASGANQKDGYVNPTVRLIDAILIDAIQSGTSDIHFEPEDQFIRLRYRIDGVLSLIRSFHKSYWPAIVVRIKIMSDMNIAEQRNPQDGRISMYVLGREVSFRVATQPTIHGENIVLRILDKQKALLPMEQLGFSDSNVKIMQKMLKRPEGVIIVTGPTGSGKSTTLYSILSFINTMDVNIMTLEDPVEYSLPIIRQSNVRENSGMDFVSGVKSMLRQDPDIIFVGEVRDNDTATMAVRAAMTGHQVYTSLHTNDAIGAIARLVDIGVSPKVLSGNIIGIIAQRLARKLCVHCKRQRPANELECKVAGLDISNAPMVFEKTGCEKCNNSGYKGRIAISEIIMINEEIDDLIFRGASKLELMAAVKKTNFKPMSEDAVDKFLKGVTDINEVIESVDMTKFL